MDCRTSALEESHPMCHLMQWKVPFLHPPQCAIQCVVRCTCHPMQWKALFLLDNGNARPAAVAACPRTMELVRSIPGRMGDVFFSCLAPGATIALHKGPTNTKVTYLPMPKPMPRC